MNPDNYIENYVVNYLKTEVERLGLKVEVIPFPDSDEEWRFEHPNASVVVNIGDPKPKEEKVYGQDIEIEIEMSFFTRKYNGKEGMRNLTWIIYPLMRKLRLPPEPNDTFTQNGNIRWVLGFRAEQTEEEAREYNYIIQKYLLPIEYNG